MRKKEGIKFKMNRMTKNIIENKMFDVVIVGGGFNDIEYVGELNHFVKDAIRIHTIILTAQKIKLWHDENDNLKTRDNLELTSFSNVKIYGIVRQLQIHLVKDHILQLSNML